MKRKDVAQALLKEAKTDLRSAKLLLDGGEYSRTIAHCQHAAEKTPKAALALRNIIITTQHAVSAEFVVAYKDFPEAQQVGLAASALEKEGTRTEYPLFGRPDLPIWIPSERYVEQDAAQALNQAEYVFQTVIGFLRKKYQI